ncbi:MAG: AMP-binding protein, partial [Planctomycetes bacterium]|nr:AMP-binding protein [Planctomycetota bacterium]
SGTTAKPKLVVSTHGGYQVYIHAMGRLCFGMKPDDVWWSTSDIGWVVGHSYIVYAPLLFGCTTIAYEGVLDYPGPETLWQVTEEFGVTAIFTSPTAVRLLMRYGEEPARNYDKSSLERIFSAGEVLNAPVWEWLQKRVLEDRVPVLDHMWQTETGGPIFGNPYGVAMLPIKPGSAGIPMPGIEAAVVTPEGEPCGPGEKGIMVIKRPFPGLTPTLWGEPERYGPDYWERIPGCYYTGDAAHIDEDGYVWFAGRADEIIKIASHRIGTIEVETAFLRHPAVAEAGVTGRPDELRGEVISAFVALREGYGLTETSPVIAAGSPDHYKVGTVGKTVPNTEIRIVAEDGTALPATQNGEILVRGPGVMKGYYRRPEETDRVIDAEGWFTTGDIGNLDDEGFLSITGRAKEMLIIGGENVFPREIEAALESHADVLQAAVIGIPDELRGEAPVAFVIPRPGADISKQLLRNHVKKLLAGFKTPKRIEICAELPTGPTGKILKRALRDRL